MSISLLILLLDVLYLHFTDTSQGRLRKLNWLLAGESNVSKRWRLYILPQYLANQTKPTRHMERYGSMAVDPTLTASLLSSLKDLQYFFVFLYALLEFSWAKHYR